MAHTRCLAQDKLDSGGYAICSLWSDTHQGQDHMDGEHRWPPCSQHCLRDHVHGRYRLKIGRYLGPESVEARAPKQSKSSAPRGACAICLHRGGELKHGRCVDREACLERAPQLDLGLES